MAIGWPKNILAGDGSLESTGGARRLNMASWKSFPSMSHFLMMFLTVCIWRSIRPFDWGNPGDEVMCSMPYLFMGVLKGWRWYYGPLLLTI